MTQEEKQLLLKDLCVRLPYGIKVLYNEINCVIENIGRDGSISLISDDSTHKKAIYLTSIEYIKPYLRTMISITVEERYELYKLLFDICSMHYIDHVINNCVNISPLYDWLNKKMFDYRGLIPKGLVIEAPEGMYGKEEQQ